MEGPAEEAVAADMGEAAVFKMEKAVALKRKMDYDRGYPWT